ncbi:MAG: phosphatidylglycerophosphatase A [Rhodoferax sp.]
MPIPPPSPLDPIIEDVEPKSASRSTPTAALRPSWRLLFSHPAHAVALGFGAGLSPKAPGTVGTLWGWFSFVALAPHLADAQWAALIAVGIVAGAWVCGYTARALRTLDPSSVVWDEIIAFWLVLWILGPSSLVGQATAFALFRLFDAAKPGPVGWADSLCHHLDPASDRWAWHKAGAGIVFDDLVAAFLTLLVIAGARFVGVA